MITLQELSEIDKVAEAIGGRIEEQFWVFDHPPNGRYMPTVSTPESHDPIYDDESHDAFRPSSDWNDAMYALQKAANGERYCIDFKLSYGLDKRMGWSVFIGQCCMSQFEESGPIAICKAILAFKQSEQDL